MPPNRFGGLRQERTSGQSNAKQGGKGQTKKNVMQDGQGSRNFMQAERPDCPPAFDAETGGPGIRKGTGDNPQTGRRKPKRGKARIGGITLGAARAYKQQT